ncbi:MAG: DNA translocase FtsK [Candidatus Improbicoccus devescovinae]|nr:MAG: DNA translocase FtsK [Candidatus Improbicoccus devescovinae]
MGILNKKKENKKDISQDIVLFFSAIFLICLFVIRGENVWFLIRRVFLGLFGFNSGIFPVLIILDIFKKKSQKLYICGRLFRYFHIFLILISIFLCIFIKRNIGFNSHFFSEIFYDAERNSGVIIGFFSSILVWAFGVIATKVMLSLVILGFIILFLQEFTEKFDFFSLFLCIFNEKNYEFFKNMKNKFSLQKYEILDEKIVNKKGLQKLKQSFENDDVDVGDGYNEQNKNYNQDFSDKDDGDISKVTAEFMKKFKNKKENKNFEFENIIRNENFITEKHEYNFPDLKLLNEPEDISQDDITSELTSNGAMLIETLESFNVKVKIVDINRGPAVTRYEIQPASGVKVSKITSLADDIALNLAAFGVRIEAPIPGKSAVGVEIPNRVVSIVKVREIISSEEFVKSESSLSVVLGRDISGKPIITDLGKMPHLLIAGSTGAGKSVCVNSFIVSILFKASPQSVKLLMIDPKVVELGVYNGIPHLLVPVVTDPKKSAGALNWAVNEMLNRYKTFAEIGVRDLASYNNYVNKNKELVNKSGELYEKMAKIVIIIDELSDLMMAAPNEIEDYICRLTQMARAAGMHLVIATQRPSVDVITGIIKANVPSRIALAVSSQVDSRTILDMGGAEKLLGRGDMLFSPVGCVKPQRVQGCYVTDDEIEKIVDYVKRDSNIFYDTKVINDIENKANNKKIENNSSDADSDEDPMLADAIKCVIETCQASTSLLQRKLRLGYARAGRLIDEMEKMGIIGPYEGSKPRQIIMTRKDFLERNFKK